MAYWEERQTALYKAGELKVNDYFKRLEKAFNQTRRELQKVVESFYWRYAEENTLTYAEAQKRLDKAEIGELKDFIDLVMQNIGKYNQEVNNMSIKARMTRYQALEAQVDAILRQLYAVDYQAEAERIMQEVYEDSYYRTWYNIDQYHGFHAEFAQIDPHSVDTLLKYPFNGANFSDRLWKQKDHLQSQLMESLTTIMIQGVPPQNLTKDFAKKMKSKKFDAYRLLHTESSFLMSEATHAGYKEDGVEQYQILATLDSKTCGICGKLDGKIFRVDEAVTGKNKPPFHCFCRCTDAAYYPDTPMEGETRVARDPETGETYEVPADMTYEEWKKSFVDGDKSDLQAVNSDEYTEQAVEPEPMKEPEKVYKQLTADDFKTIKQPITKAERSIIYGKTHFSGYINSSNARKMNALLREGKELPADYREIELALRGVIGRYGLPDDLLVTRYVAADALEGMFGVAVPQYKLTQEVDDFWKQIEELPSLLGSDKIYTEKGFLSTSGVVDKNVMTDKVIKLIIKAPKGTHSYVTTNYKESEIIFDENTSLHLVNSYIENPRQSGWKIVLECEIR